MEGIAQRIYKIHRSLRVAHEDYPSLHLERLLIRLNKQGSDSDSAAQITVKLFEGRRNLSGMVSFFLKKIKSCQESYLPLVLTFINYDKAFDSIETIAVLSALVYQGVNLSYIRTLAACCRTCITIYSLSADY